MPKTYQTADELQKDMESTYEEAQRPTGDGFVISNKKLLVLYLCYVAATLSGLVALYYMTHSWYVFIVVFIVLEAFSFVMGIKRELKKRGVLKPNGQVDERKIR
jgi:Flp pilus assembly protein TadB